MCIGILFFFSKSRPKVIENLYLDTYSHILDLYFFIWSNTECLSSGSSNIFYRQEPSQTRKCQTAVFTESIFILYYKQWGEWLEKSHDSFLSLTHGISYQLIPSNSEAISLVDHHPWILFCLMNGHLPKFRVYNPMYSASTTLGILNICLFLLLPIFRNLPICR